MNKLQHGDALIYQGPDDGECNVEDGILEMTQNFDSFIYLILLGPNEEDDGSQGTEHLQWLGNEDEPEENQLRGKFHQLFRALPITSGTMKELQGAAIDDITAGFGDLLSAVDVVVSATSINSVFVNGKLYLSTGAVETFGMELFK